MYCIQYYYLVLSYLSLLQYFLWEQRLMPNSWIRFWFFDSEAVEKEISSPLITVSLTYTLLLSSQTQLEHFSRQYHNSAPMSLQVSHDLRKWSDHFSSWKSTNWLDSNSAKWILYCNVLYSYEIVLNLPGFFSNLSNWAALPSILIFKYCKYL